MKICKICNKQLSAENFNKHPNTKDGLNIYCKECGKEYAKNHYWANVEKRRQYYKDTIEKTKLYKKEHNGHPNTIFSSIKCQAKKRKVPFELVLNEFVNWYLTIEKKCFYCKRPIEECLKDKGIGHGIFRLTIDRKDNDLGYSLTNLALACYRCNNIKSDYFTEEEMLEIGKMIFKKEKNNGNRE